MLEDDAEAALHRIQFDFLLQLLVKRLEDAACGAIVDTLLDGHDTLLETAEGRAAMVALVDDSVP